MTVKYISQEKTPRYNCFILKAKAYCGVCRSVFSCRSILSSFLPSVLLCRGKASKDFTGPDCRFLSFKTGETIYVYYKLSGQRSDIWAGSVSMSVNHSSLVHLSTKPLVVRTVDTNQSSVWKLRQCSCDVLLQNVCRWMLIISQGFSRMVGLFWSFFGIAEAKKWWNHKHCILLLISSQWDTSVMAFYEMCCDVAPRSKSP